MAWRKYLPKFGVAAAGANFAYGVKHGLDGEAFTPQDVFNPVDTVGKMLGKAVHTHQALKEARAQGDMELETLRLKNAAPQFTTNYPHPPVLSEDTQKRIENGMKALYS